MKFLSRARARREKLTIVKLGQNIIAQSGLPPFFRLSGPGASAFHAPPPRPHYPGGDALRTAVRALSGFQKEAVVTSARTGQSWRLVSDEGPYLNGHDAAPCPLAFFTAGMAASFVNEISALALRDGVTLRRLRLVQDNFYTMKGSMPKRTMQGGAEPVALTVEVDCDLPDAALAELLTNAVCAAPVHGLMRHRLQSKFRLARNGKPLPTGRAAELDAAILPDPAGLFDGSTFDAPDLTLMAPVGITPRKPVAGGTSAGGSSLSDEQNRRLNIGAIASLLADGLKDIQQMQYSPHGTSFRFLSAEDGRAPDAGTLVSAGLGFCFMTQFGRFASMLDLDLSGYRILQDTHFSAGGASGGSGRAGAADPVETHVFLDTSESDATVREMLDVAEQTCFLHALCRTDLKVRLKISRP